MASNLDFALWYANNMKWAVLPLHTPNKRGQCSCGVRDCKSAGKHPRTEHGVHDASKNKSQIVEWWSKWPNANIGLAAGEESGVIVIDVDPRNKGDRSLKKLSEKPPRSIVAKTGGGGHHYFAAYTDEPVDNKPASGIDIQSSNRIVVLPPSLHGSGQRYKWEKKPRRNKLKPLPDWALKSKSKGERPDGDRVGRDRVLYEGERDNELMRRFGLWRRMGLAESEIRAAGWTYNLKWCEPPLSDGDIDRLAKSASKYAVVVDPSAEPLSLTQLGLARRLELLHGAEIRYSKFVKGWIVWNGRFWERDGDVEVRHLVYNVANMLRDEAVNVKDDKERIKLLRKADECESARPVSDILKTAESMPSLSAARHEWDADPWLFNVSNGTLDLREGEVKFREHRKGDYQTKLSPVIYNPDAKAPVFRRFIRETFKGDKELVLYIQKFFGYSLTGDVREQIFPVFWGIGRNGKTKLLDDICGAVFGKSYRAELTADMLLDKRYASHPTEVMDLQGARIGIASESGKKRSLDEEMVKKLTGDGTIKGRRMHKNFEEYKPTHKLILVTNFKPRTSNSAAIWRRLRLVPFTNMITDENDDKELGHKLIEEAPGILNWMIRGCLLWQSEGLGTPEAVSSLTAKHREDQDLVGAYFTEAVVFSPEHKCTVTDLYMSYQLWCADASLRPLGKLNFNKEVTERYAENVAKINRRGRLLWVGLKPLLTIKS